MHSTLKGFMDARMLWPEDAEELIKLTNDTPTLEELGDPYYSISCARR